MRVSVCVCVTKGACGGGPARAEADAPRFSSPGPSAGHPRWRGPPSLLVTGRTPVTLRNPAQGLPWGLRGEGSTCQGRRHRLYPWSRKTSRASEQLSRCTPRAEPTLQSPGAESTEAPRPWSPHSTPREAHAPPAANRGEPELGATRLLA